MALRALPGHMMFPDYTALHRGTAFGTMLLDAADEKAAFVFRVPKAGTITKVGFRTSTVTTGATVDVRLETVDASGNPSGVLAGTNTNASQVIASTDDNVWFTVTLTAGYAASTGTVLAIVIVNPSASPGNLNIARITTTFEAITGFPYSDLFIGGWAKSSSSGMLCYIEYSDGTTAPFGNLPLSALASVSFNSGSTPDERGHIFQLPVPARMAGVVCVLDGLAEANFDVVLYDSDGSTVLASVSHDGDYGGNLVNQAVYYMLFGTSIALNANVAYRATLKPTTTNNIQVPEFTVPSNAFLNAVSGGKDIFRTTRTDGGAWTENDAVRMPLALLLDGLDDGVGPFRPLLSPQVAIQ